MLVRQILLQHGQLSICGKQQLQGLTIIGGSRAQRPHCVKHSQHAKHANVIGGSGGIPPEKVLKNRCSDIEFGVILGLSQVYDNAFIYLKSWLSDGRLQLASYVITEQQLQLQNNCINLVASYGYSQLGNQKTISYST